MTVSTTIRTRRPIELTFVLTRPILTVVDERGED